MMNERSAEVEEKRNEYLGEKRRRLLECEMWLKGSDGRNKT